MKTLSIIALTTLSIGQLACADQVYESSKARFVLFSTPGANYTGTLSSIIYWEFTGISRDGRVPFGRCVQQWRPNFNNNVDASLVSEAFCYKSNRFYGLPSLPDYPGATIMASDEHGLSFYGYHHFGLMDAGYGYQTANIRPAKWNGQGNVTILHTNWGFVSGASADGEVLAGAILKSGAALYDLDSRRGVAWNAGIMVILQRLAGDWESFGRGVSKDGQFVCGSGPVVAHGGNPESRAYVWATTNNTVVGGSSMGSLFNDDSSRAHKISADGTTCIGISYASTGYGGPRQSIARWRNGVIENLGLNAGFFSDYVVAGIRSDGRVFVYSDYEAGGLAVSFIWRDGIGPRQMEDVLNNELGINVGNRDAVFVTGMSDDGRVIIGRNWILYLYDNIRLDSKLVGGGLQLSWPGWLTGWRVQRRPLGQSSWQDVITLDGNQSSLIEPLASGAFYRLVK